MQAGFAAKFNALLLLIKADDCREEEVLNKRKVDSPDLQSCWPSRSQSEILPNPRTIFQRRIRPELHPERSMH